MVGASKLLLILLFLLLMNLYLSLPHTSSASSLRAKPLPPPTDEENQYALTAANWPRRILVGGVGAMSNKGAHHHTRHSLDTSRRMSPFSTDAPANRHASPDEGDDRQNASLIPKGMQPSGHAINSTAMDPRYGVEKRLVPTGPNPLHN